MENLKKEIEKLKKQIHKLKKENKALKNCNKIDDYELYLFVDNKNNLCIAYNKKYKQYLLGYIDNEGYCHILSNKKFIKNLEIWEENHMKVYGAEEGEITTEWNDKNYMIDGYILTSREEMLKCESYAGIYDFFTCEPIMSCHDDNIKRHSFTNTPIII